MSAIAELLGAIRLGDASAVRDQLAASPDLATARDERGNSALLIATYSGQHEIVRLLLAGGARASFFGSPAGHTPLHEAAFNGDLALARLRLERGADRSVRTAEGETPLDIAVKHGRAEVVRLLRG